MNEWKQFSHRMVIVSVWRDSTIQWWLQSDSTKEPIQLSFVFRMEDPKDQDLDVSPGASHV